MSTIKSESKKVKVKAKQAKWFETNHQSWDDEDVYGYEYIATLRSESENKKGKEKEQVMWNKPQKLK